MRLTSVNISNYRQYKDVKFEFKKNQEFDLHVVIGSNGVGKTNLLNAITWCFYGSEPHLGNDSKSLPIPNLIAIKESENGYIDVSVEIKIEDNGNPITFIRTRKFRDVEGKDPFPLKDSFKVIETSPTGNSKIYEEENTNIFVNRFVPEKIKEYFFFDGEQLDNYFLGDQAVLIRDSVFAISQVQLLQSINERILKVKQTYELDAAKSNPNIEKLTKSRILIEDQISAINTVISELENQISISKVIIKQKKWFFIRTRWYRETWKRLSRNKSKAYRFKNKKKRIAS